jgi:hypothetical protein
MRENYHGISHGVHHGSRRIYASRISINIKTRNIVMKRSSAMISACLTFAMLQACTTEPVKVLPSDVEIEDKATRSAVIACGGGAESSTGAALIGEYDKQSTKGKLSLELMRKFRAFYVKDFPEDSRDAAYGKFTSCLTALLGKDKVPTLPEDTKSAAKT